MLHSRRSIFMLFCMLVGVHMSLVCSKIVQGDAGIDQTTTFTFSIGAFAYDAIANQLYIGAEKETDGNVFTLAVSEQGNPFKSLLTGPVNEKGQLLMDHDGQPVKNSPLIGQAVTHLALVHDKVAFITKAAPNTLQFLYPIHPLLKSAQLITADLGSSVYNSVLLTTIVDTKGVSHLLIALNYENRTELCLFGIGAKPVENEEVKERQEKSIKAIKEEINQRNDTEENKNKRINEVETLYRLRPVLLKEATLSFTPEQCCMATGPLQSIAIADLHFDPMLKRLYLSFKTTVAYESSSVCTLGIGFFNNETFVVKPLVNSKLLSVLPSTLACSYEKIRTMQTTTHLSYALGAHSSNERGAFVYAFPLLDHHSASVKGMQKQGMLAAKKQSPLAIHGLQYPYNFKGRGFVKAALKAEQVPVHDDAAALVGGGPLPLVADQKISQLLALNDAVFVAIDQPSTMADPAGVYHSQALLNEEGTIMGWTPWRPLAGTRKPLRGLMCSALSGLFWLLPSQEPQTVRLTQWGLDKQFEHPALAQLKQTFEEEKDGIRYMTEVMYPEPSLLALGRDCLVLVKTVSHHKIFDKETSLAVMKGSGLAAIAPLTTATSTKYGLLVGGARGLAINASVEYCPVFKEFGAYTDVKKIISDDIYIYVLTGTKLDRIKLADDIFESEIVTLATIESLPGVSSGHFFNDVIIAGKLALLASSAGLWRSSDGNLVNDPALVHAHDLGWTAVPLPEGSPMVTKLIALSPTGIELGLCTGGMLLVLNGAVGQRSRLNRLAINPTVQDMVTHKTVQPIPDHFIKDTFSPMVEFGTRRTQVLSDGMLILSVVPKIGEHGMQLQTLNIKGGERYAANFRGLLLAQWEPQQASHINLFYSSTLATVIAYGDFGLIAHG
jgi:hypothetical protein